MGKGTSQFVKSAVQVDFWASCGGGLSVHPRVTKRHESNVVGGFYSVPMQDLRFFVPSSAFVLDSAPGVPAVLQLLQSWWLAICMS